MPVRLISADLFGYADNRMEELKDVNFKDNRYGPMSKERRAKIRIHKGPIHPWYIRRMIYLKETGQRTYQMKKELKEDKWAMAAIKYLIRKDYSVQEILDAITEVGIKKGIGLGKEKKA